MGAVVYIYGKEAVKGTPFEDGPEKRGLVQINHQINHQDTRHEKCGYAVRVGNDLVNAGGNLYVKIVQQGISMSEQRTEISRA